MDPLSLRVPDRFSARQQRTRERGLCIVCHVRAPRGERTVCEWCNEKAKDRVRRARAQARSFRAARYEAAGDDAALRFAHGQANDDYQRALATTSDEAARSRLAEKLGHVLYLWKRPLEARGWLLLAIERYARLENCESDVLRVVLRLARQYWLESDTRGALLVIDKALTGISPERDLAAYLYASVFKASYLNLLDRYDETAAVLDALGSHVADADVDTLAGYYRARGVVAAVQGRRAESFAAFDAACEYAQQRSDGYWLVCTLDEQAYRAVALGETHLALECRERAVAIARERRLGWTVASNLLERAMLLLLVGEDDRAAALVREAAGISDETPTVRILLASVGVTVAVAVGDEDLLCRCALHDAIDLAFASGEPDRIVRIAAAFGELFYRDGARAEAESLIRRALGFVRVRDYAWDLAVVALRHTTDPALRAEVLATMRRARGPRTPVSRAMQRLCVALTADDRTAAAEAASSALRGFRALGWSRYARLAERVPATRDVERRRLRAGALAALKPRLTRRERQVAELVLNGLTNKVIAERLGITAHTVESHMTSILARLELRSRWQLARAVEEALAG